MSNLHTFIDSDRPGLADKISERSQTYILSHDYECYLAEKAQMEESNRSQDNQQRNLLESACNFEVRGQGVSPDLSSAYRNDLEWELLCESLKKDVEREMLLSKPAKPASRWTWKQSQAREGCKSFLKVIKSIVLQRPIPPSKKQVAAIKPNIVDVAAICYVTKKTQSSP